MKHEPQLNLLDIVAELMDLPTEQRTARLAQLSLSPEQQSEVDRCLAAQAAAAGFLDHVPTLVRAARSSGWLEDDAPPPGPPIFSDGPDRSPVPVHLPSQLPPHIEGYEITAKLGEGGMGVVYRAVQLATRREVALKLLPAGMLSGKARARFEREVELAARLEHPYIARVYDSGLQRDACFFAMELVSGQPLDAIRCREGNGAPSDPGAVSQGLRRRTPCPPARHHPPRSQALQHPGDARRCATPAGLRHRQGPFVIRREYHPHC